MPCDPPFAEIEGVAPLPAKTLAEDQITYPARNVGCFGPDAVKAIRGFEIDGNMADFRVTGMSGRWALRKDRDVKSARQQPLDDDESKPACPADYDGVLSTH